MKKFNITVNGTAYKVEVEEIGAAAAPAAVAAPVAAPAAPVVGGNTEIVAPMPGTIVSVPAKAGEAVKKGQVLVVFEALKMEQEVTAPCDGTVAAVLVNQGEAIEAGKVLVTLN
jgi:biotin carboxyl carrier protein